MNRTDIQERLEAIVEDTLGSPRHFAMRDEITSFFEPEDLPVFCELLGEEFDVDGELLVAESSNFYALIETINSELS